MSGPKQPQKLKPQYRGLKPFRKGEERARELGRKGGRRTPRSDYRAPYAGSILKAMAAAGLSGPTWSAWRAVWKAIFALPPSPEEHALYSRHTGRKQWPKRQCSEAFLVAGRGAGKSRNAAFAGTYLGVRFDNQVLAPGELALIPIIAANTDQARITFGYLKAFFQLDEFRPFVQRVLKRSIELKTGVNIEVFAGSFRTLRGYTIPACVADELAFWARESDSLNADTEVVDAIRPGLGRVDDSLLLAISSPYARKGELWEVYERSHGVDDQHVLVWNADTLSMNPTYQAWRIERAFEDDPVAAASEYGSNGSVVFRTDVESFLDPAALSAVTVPDRRELPPVADTQYVGFTDPSGGSRDSFTVAVGHREGDNRAVLDAVRERKPPFSPDSVVEEFASLLMSYGVSEVIGDRYAGEWPREAFLKYGVTYKPSERVKSALYQELIAPINSGRIDLLDHRVLRSQLLSLERRTARGGKDSIDHPVGGRDDVANSVAGVLVNVLPRVGGKKRVLFA